jgi:adenosylcobinamide kinase/adenosylcobinamide-phosphate guanylyltransferase
MVVEPLPARGLVLVSGPSRGGKSRWAEHLAEQSTAAVTYIATGPQPGGDASWQQRVEQHQGRRPNGWKTIESGPDLEGTLEQLLAAERLQAPSCLLIDSLGSWLAWHLDDTPQRWSERCGQLTHLLLAQPGPVLLVVEETGWGVVPPTAIGGLFRDRLGALQQQLTARCSAAWLVVAGRALNLLSLGIAVPNL